MSVRRRQRDERVIRFWFSLKGCDCPNHFHPILLQKEVWVEFTFNYPDDVHIGYGSFYALAFPVALRRRISSVAAQLGSSFYASALPLTLCRHSHWHVNQNLYWLKTRMHPNAGVDAYETPRRERIKCATKAKSECVHFPLTLIRRHKRSPNLS